MHALAPLGTIVTPPTRRLIYFRYGVDSGLPYYMLADLLITLPRRLARTNTNVVNTVTMEEVYVFGDQTADCRAFFTKVFTRKDDVLLQSFLEQASEAIRVENRSRSHPSKAVPNFNTVQELVDRYYASESRDAAVESALVCISQLTHFIGYEVVPKYPPRPVLTSAVHLKKSLNLIYSLIQMLD